MIVSFAAKEVQPPHVGSFSHIGLIRKSWANCEFFKTAAVSSSISTVSSILNAKFASDIDFSCPVIPPL